MPLLQQSEPIREAAVAKFAATASDGKTYQAEFYNLDGIISVGYRGKTNRDTQFRIWATGILKESMCKEFVPDDERLKNLYKKAATCQKLQLVQILLKLRITELKRIYYGRRRLELKRLAEANFSHSQCAKVGFL